MKITIEVNGPSEAEVAIETLSAYRDAATVAVPDKKPTVKEAKEPADKKPAAKKPAAKKEKKPDADDLDLKSLTQLAKETVTRTDRVQVKKVISEYGEKLSAVDPEDYASLAEDLKAL